VAKAKKTKRTVPKDLSHTLYCYVEPANGAHAREEGAKLFGSYSAYINALIAKDRGVPPILGTWKAPGESKALRKQSPTPPPSDTSKVELPHGGEVHFKNQPSDDEYEGIE
jgi:hypothetical protein